jgi:hypothetical protein
MVSLLTVAVPVLGLPAGVLGHIRNFFECDHGLPGFCLPELNDHIPSSHFEYFHTLIASWDVGALPGGSPGISIPADFTAAGSVGGTDWSSSHTPGEFPGKHADIGVFFY